MPDVILTNVRKDYGSIVAVDDLNLSIEEGEFVSLLGPSGCGKTTTLRMLAGLEFPTGGEIEIAGRVVNDVEPGKRDIAMVFQSYALYPHMTVEKNIGYPLKKRGVPKAERAKMVAQAAELLQLTPLLQRRPKQLSGGQQQRVALGRALVRDPKVFLLDEPLSNLDAKLRGYMRAELVELHARLGRTMVYVTHDQLEAMTMSDRIAIMLDGKLQQFAPPQQVYRAPANRFVAGFIGTPSMNLIDGDLRKGGDSWIFQADGMSVAVGSLTEDARPGAACMGVRPESVILGSGPMQAVVKLVEQTGHENIVAIQTGENIRLTGRMQANDQPKVGSNIAFDIDRDAAHIFGPGATGARLNNDSTSIAAKERLQNVS